MTMNDRRKATATPFGSDGLREGMLFCGLLVFGIACAWGIDVPNVKPIAAIGLFAGVVFRRTIFAWACPLLLIWLTIFSQGIANWQIQLVVAAGLLLSVCLGRELRRRRCFGTLRSIARGSVLSLVGASLVCSIAFFLVSNWGWWQFSGLYPYTAGGLVQCMAAGLPFLLNTVAGDLCFNGTLFGLAALAVSSPIKSAIWMALRAAPLRS